MGKKVDLDLNQAYSYRCNSFLGVVFPRGTSFCLYRYFFSGLSSQRNIFCLYRYFLRWTVYGGGGVVWPGLYSRTCSAQSGLALVRRCITIWRVCLLARHRIVHQVNPGGSGHWWRILKKKMRILALLLDWSLT